MTNPVIALSLAPPVITKPSAPAPALAPLSSTIGVDTNPGCVVAMRYVGAVIAGSGEVGWIVNGPVPGSVKKTMLKSGLAFASMMAWRSDPGPLSLVVVTSIAEAVTSDSIATTAESGTPIAYTGSAARVSMIV